MVYSILETVGKSKVKIWSKERASWAQECTGVYDDFYSTPRLMTKSTATTNNRSMAAIVIEVKCEHQTVIYWNIVYHQHLNSGGGAGSEFRAVGEERNKDEGAYRLQF